ncbi:hypothetical protein [Bythopirellula goksoeyrii]|uniref:Uncharacterized protein n=1 Tax=Bythopirellula goksoeyrii TaxID=1400387 RepID=A0A5B9Q4W5_9BACT|nr:hypothetical protein [Bythopirellula goksoeyrii]QEG34017.1 hypothetical protein Pr1d_12890 [Bythopirellula goksoeyrii]
MNRKRKWLVDRPCEKNSQSNLLYPRRIVAPERLESRIAPGVMLPLFGPVFDDSDSSSRGDAESTSTVRVACHYYLDEVETSTIPAQIVHSFDIEETEAIEETPVTALSFTTVRPRIPYEVAALDSAFESLGYELESILDELPTRLIQPVIMDPTSPHNQEEDPETPVTDTTTVASSTNLDLELIAAPIPVGNVRADVSTPVMSSNEVNVPGELPAELGPRIIQPVIMDPESEHNVPN